MQNSGSVEVEKGVKKWQRPSRFPWRAVVIPGDDLLSPAKDYHGPWMLNGRVRNGNGWDHPGMLTEKAS